jgi:hypothetical protein
MPLLESRVSAVLPVCSASAEFSRPAAADAVLVFVVDVAELELEALVALLLDVLVDEADELDDVLEELPVVAVGVTGWKKLLPAANPTLAA